MNPAQKAALGIGIVAIALMGVFPPWSLTVVVDTIHSTTPAGYAPIYEPPKPPESPVYTVSIDVTRLLVEWAITAALTGGLVLILRSNTRNASKNGPLTL